MVGKIIYFPQKYLWCRWGTEFSKNWRFISLSSTKFIEFTLEKTHKFTPKKSQVKLCPKQSLLGGRRGASLRYFFYSQFYDFPKCFFW